MEVERDRAHHHLDQKRLKSVDLQLRGDLELSNGIDTLRLNNTGDEFRLNFPSFGSVFRLLQSSRKILPQKLPFRLELFVAVKARVIASLELGPDGRSVKLHPIRYMFKR